MTIIIPGLPFSFDGMITLGWIAFFLITGVALRAFVPFFRKFLIPACIIGGVLGLIFQGTGLLARTGIAPDYDILQMMVFHFYNFTWIFIGMRIPQILSGAKKSKSGMPKVLWLACMNSFVLAATGAIGILVSMAVLKVGLFSGPASIGQLMANGFIGGPGQALTLGGIWEQYGYVGLKDFGLASASLGYAMAIIVGIPLLNIIARKQKINVMSNASASEQVGFYSKNETTPTLGRMTTMPNNLDVVAWHLGLGLLAYLLSFILIAIIIIVMPKSLVPVLWSVFFIAALLCGILIRKILKFMGKEDLLDNGVNSRITNTLVDFLVCGTFIGISVGNIGPYLWLFLVTGITIITFVACFVWWASSRLATDGLETFAWCFGAWTGTVSTGMLLLRMIDPESKSEVPVQYGVANAFAVPLFIFMSIISHFEVVYGRPPLQLVAIFGGTALVLLIGMRLCKVPRKKAGWGVEPS